MLANLPAIRRRSRCGRGFVLVQPQFEALLSDAGMTEPQDFLEHPGEMIGGHPDRNVAKVMLEAAARPIAAILKREYRVSWTDRLKSLLAGFGWYSTSCREALTLELLAKSGIVAPEWLAAGEDGERRAFVLVRAVEGVDLRRLLLSMRRRPARERHEFCRRLGGLIATMHDRGIAHPDLYAKHILVDRDSNRITLVDWQRTLRPHVLSVATRSRDLAALHASVADELADAEDRQAFLLAYCRACATKLPPFDELCRQIERGAEARLQRSSVREQRLPTWHESQSLLWLDGEALAATPRCRRLWSCAELRQMAYGMQGRHESERSMTIWRPDRLPARLIQRRTSRLLRQIGDWWRGRRWTSPELHAAAHLLRQERLGAAPTLLAFGQRLLAGGIVESFLLQDADQP